MHSDLVERGHSDLKLGYSAMKTTFTQLYDSRANLEKEILARSGQEIKNIKMPRITFAKTILDDIVGGTANSELIQWCQANS